jgi:hypothetical protein
MKGNQVKNCSTPNEATVQFGWGMGLVSSREKCVVCVSVLHIFCREALSLVFLVNAAKSK